jgi:chromosome segregation ATPase
MKRDVNFYLFGLLFFLLLSMVGLAFYFNYTYEGINARYEKSLKNLKNLSRELNATIYELNKKNLELIRKEKTLIDIVNELNLSKQKISSLGDFYTQEKGVREELEENLQETMQERDFWKLNYTQTKQDLDLWKKNYQVKERELRRASSRISSLEVIIGNIKREIEHDNGVDEHLGDIERKISAIEDVLDDIEDIIFEIRGEDPKENLKEKVEELEDLVLELKGKVSKLKNNINEIKASLDRA